SRTYPFFWASPGSSAASPSPFTASISPTALSADPQPDGHSRSRVLRLPPLAPGGVRSGTLTTMSRSRAGVLKLCQPDTAALIEQPFDRPADAGTTVRHRLCPPP